MYTTIEANANTMTARANIAAHTVAEQSARTWAEHGITGATLATRCAAAYALAGMARELLHLPRDARPIDWLARIQGCCAGARALAELTRGELLRATAQGQVQ